MYSDDALREIWRVITDPTAKPTRKLDRVFRVLIQAGVGGAGVDEGATHGDHATTAHPDGGAERPDARARAAREPARGRHPGRRADRSTPTPALSSTHTAALERRR